MDVPARAAGGLLSRRDIYSVSRLNREARLLLEGGFTALWIEGEISNLARPASGHLYFALKDAQAQIRCALFRGSLRGLACRPRDGMHVLVRARASLYEGRGEFQLVVEHMEEAGEGALRRAFEALKVRLAAEGLFDTARKRPLPSLPRRIGVVTSSSGAALRDILSTLRRRFPAIRVLLYATPVQGEGAADKIAAMIRLASQRADCDALIIARGGGSLEDLWAFNEEVVARALAECRIPTVAGIGHEIDVTIADLVADVRAPTPTAAAELLSPHREEWLARCNHQSTRVALLMRRFLAEREQRVDSLCARLISPRQRLSQARMRLDALAHRLRLAHSHSLAAARAAAFRAHLRLERQAPTARLRELHLRTSRQHERLLGAARAIVHHQRQRLLATVRALDTVSPLATLERGYAIVQRHDDPAPLRDARAIARGTIVRARLARGWLDCRVEEQGE